MTVVFSSPCLLYCRPNKQQQQQAGTIPHNRPSRTRFSFYTRLHVSLTHVIPDPGSRTSGPGTLPDLVTHA
eukprot:767116-Hanusia_phi.AAC.1